MKKTGDRLDYETASFDRNGFVWQTNLFHGNAAKAYHAPRITRNVISEMNVS
jgi:hypothetical protein